LFVSFTLDPMLSSLWPDPPERRFAYAPWLGRLMETIERGIDALHRAYGRLLAWSLQNRVTVLTFAAAVFFGSFLMLPLIGTEFQPSADEGFISLRLRTPTGSSLEYTDAKVRQVERILRGLPEIADIATSVGTEEGINTARLDLRLVDRSRIRRRNQKTIEQALRRRLAPVAGVQVSLGWNKPIFVSVLGPEPAVLTDIAQKLMREMARIPGIADLESSEQAAEPTLAVRIRQDVAADLGLTNAAIGNALRPLIAGDQISHWLAPDGQDYDVTVRLPRNDRRVATDIGDLYLTSARLDSDGSPLLVPLRQVADLVETSTPAQLKRLDLQRRVSIYANAQGRATGDVGRDVRKLLEHTPLPPGYRFDIGGAQQDMDESFSAALQALALAVIFIYLILASQFASFLQPVAIMASLPLSLTGVFLALLLTHTTLNLFSIIGFIMLMGLVTKNAILLVDFTNRGLRDGKTLPAAILDAGQVRLRPILMTTCAMVFGMLPMAIGFGEGGELQAPMGRAVIGGVITSTLLTLVVVPVIYSYLYALSSRARRLWGAAAGPAQPLPSAATPPDIADDCADAIADDVAIDDAPVASSAQ
jgi:multidrug efflux pump subunit AcrB